MSLPPPLSSTPKGGMFRGLRPVVLRAAAFALVFALLQVLWEAARGGVVERVWTDDLTVRAAVGWVNLLTPAVKASAAGHRIAAEGGGINVLQGCEGTEVWFLLVAAFVVFHLPWRLRLLGVLAGLGWVWLLNQARIVALFYAYRSGKAGFDLLHTTGAPLLMIVLTGLYFQWWLMRSTAAAHALRHRAWIP